MHAGEQNGMQNDDESGRKGVEEQSIGNHENGEEEAAVVVLNEGIGTEGGRRKKARH
jgi:hypothetical protein